MEQSRKKMRFEILFDRYLSNFPRIMLTNLMFFVPLIAALAGFYFVLKLSNPLISVAASVVLLMVLFPFYSGVVLVCRNIARGDEKVKVFSTFIKGIKENYKKFLVYGFLVSLISIFSYFSIFLYSQMLSASWLFYVAMFICILIVLAIMFIFFYVPVMTVTFDLSLKHILKNSFLMSFGEIKNNFFALVALAVVFAFCFTMVAFATIEILVVIITLLILALILPASAQFVVSYYIFDDMYDTIAHRDSKSKAIDEKIVDAKNKKNGENKVVTDTEDYSGVDITTLKDTDDYIFYNGKMMKQSELLRKVLEQRANKSDESE